MLKNRRQTLLPEAVLVPPGPDFAFTAKIFIFAF